MGDAVAVTGSNRKRGKEVSPIEEKTQRDEKMKFIVGQ